MITFDCSRYSYTIGQKIVPTPNRQRLSDTIEALFQKEAALRPTTAEFTPRRVRELKAHILFTDTLSDYVANKYWRRYFFIALVVIWLSKQLQMGSFGQMEKIRSSLQARLNQEVSLLGTAAVAEEAMQLHLKSSQYTNGAGEHYYSLENSRLIATTKVKRVETALCYSRIKKTCRLIAKITTREEASPATKEATLREFHFYQRLQGANGIWPILYGAQNDNQVILFEELAQGTFSQLAKRMTREELKNSIKTLLEGLVALKNEGILHMDLKGSNVLVDKVRGLVGISDFGHADDIKSERLANRLAYFQTYGKYGTTQYTPPELYGVQGFQPSYSLDMWPFGLLLYKTLINPAFMGISEKIEPTYEHKEAYKNAVQQEADRLLTYPQDSLEAFIGKLLQADPKKRPSAEDALQEFLKVT